MYKFKSLTSIFLITFSISIYSQTSNQDSSWWDDTKNFFKDSPKNLKNFFDQDKSLDEEVADLLDKETSWVNTINKIDSISDYVPKYTSLKEKDIANECRNGFSKTNCRIQIDNILEDIEKILFDGEIVNYSKKIRQLKARIIELEDEKANLNEKKFGVDNEEEAQAIINQISDIDALITKFKNYIDELEDDLQVKMKNLDINLSKAQIQVMTSRVDGDDLAKSIAIFDITKQISNTLGELMKENSFSTNSTTKYYGVYLILTEILGFAQREYILKIDDEYLTKLDLIKEDVYESINYSNKQKKEASMQSSKVIFDNNIDADKFTIKVIDDYKDLLMNQKVQLKDVLLITEEKITVAYSSYNSSMNSAAVMSIINDTQSTFDQIMELQIPDIIPFENTALEVEFKKLSEKLISQ
tara:strand:+ start:841 stop:2082 length:1242 start_codon:yes stop_codon:yes gene_type:complete